MMTYVENNYQIKCHTELSNTKRILNMCGAVLTSLVEENRQLCTRDKGTCLYSDYSSVHLWL
jgi:hypothetical protein